MPVLKRSTKGSNSVTAKLINKTKANIGLHNNINNHLNENNISELTKSQNQYNHYHTKSDDEVIVLTAKQKQQLLRNEYLEQLTKEQLKIEAKRRGQKTSGTKSELLQRLGYKMSLKQSVSLNNIKQTSAGQMKTSQSSNGSLPVGGNGKNSVDKERLRKEREHLKLWIHPITTIKYFGYECVTLFQLYKKNFMNYKKTIALLTVIIALIAALWYVPGKHQIYIEEIRKNFFFIVYWVGLGVLSSVGLGTGLHTFILYLGPHIASVTLAAYECNSLDFPEPPYPNDIVCPDDVTPGFIPSLWNIMTKVRYEAFLWGAGTALGELPPYFMAKAARLSGHDPDDAEEMDEFEKLQKKNELGDLNFFDKIKLFMETTVERVGFFGILACASIPNPLFDLAGITCGHFLVPFWTFFGATLIGKAVIKMHIQKILVIVAFNEILIEKAVDKIAFIPVVGKRLQEPFKSFLQNQKTKLHRGKTDKMGGGNLLQKVFEVFVIGMVIYFVVSIINSFAQSYHKRIHKKPSKKLRKSGKEN